MTGQEFYQFTLNNVRSALKRESKAIADRKTTSGLEINKFFKRFEIYNKVRERMNKAQLFAELDTVEIGFLKMISHDRHNDNIRSVYRDWLEQRGEHNKAKMLQFLMEKKWGAIATLRSEIQSAIDMAWFNAVDTESQFSDLEGRVLKSIIRVGDEIHFETDNGEEFKLRHEQDCCERVYLSQIDGDFKDLIGYPLVKAEKSSYRQSVEDGIEGWTFYQMATVKGYVDMRWQGSSNGYYSIGVDFEKVMDESDDEE